MKYWILVALLSGLFTLVMQFAAPEMFGSTVHYAGVAICALIAFIITLRDPPDMSDKVLFYFFKWGVLASGPVLVIWGLGYKLEFWGSHNSDAVSSFDSILPTLAVLSGILILVSAWMLWRRRE